MKSNSTGKTLTRRTGLLLATMAAGLVLATGVALANTVPCPGNQACGGPTPQSNPSEGDDIFNGSELADFMVARGGNDKGYGLGGDDVMWGNDGDDTMEGGTGNDTMNGDAGTDAMNGGDGDDRFGGGDGDDTFDGGEGKDTFVGGPGSDEMNAGAGDDTFYVSSGRDVFKGGEGNDYSGLTAGVEDLDTDLLEGEKGEDRLFGGGGGDTIYGGEDDDVLGRAIDRDDVDPGTDWFGGEGGDDFIFAKDGENDTIDCGEEKREGEKDVAEVDYGLNEWQSVQNCEVIWDGKEPSVTKERPTSNTNDPTPSIQALIKDSHPQAKVPPKANVRLYVDGRQVKTFSYSETSGALAHRPRKNLAPGKHTVKLIVLDEEGLEATKEWSFKVEKKKK